MDETCRHGHILGHSAGTRKADLVVASLAEIGCSLATIGADAAIEKAFRHDLIARRDPLHARPHCGHHARPFVARYHRVAIVACGTTPLVKLDIAATDTHSVRLDQHVVWSRRGHLYFGHLCGAGFGDDEGFHIFSSVSLSFGIVLAVMPGQRFADGMLAANLAKSAPHNYTHYTPTGVGLF